jgi:hypothetical protein
VGSAGRARDRVATIARTRVCSRQTRISNSEGATASTAAIDNSCTQLARFLGGYPNSRHGCVVLVIAPGERCSATTGTRPRETPLDLAQQTSWAQGRRARWTVGARKIATTRGAGAFRSPDRSTPARPFRFGGQRRQSSTANRLFCSTASAKEVFAPLVQISELPHSRKDSRAALRRGRRRDARSARSCATVCAGLLPRQLLGSQARHEIDRQCGRQSQPDHQDTRQDFQALLKQMGTVSVTELMGQGVIR